VKKPRAGFSGLAQTNVTSKGKHIMIIRQESTHSINGVPGRMFTLRKPPAPWVAGVFANQTWASEPRPVKGYGLGAALSVDVRFDDNCKNGHNSFAITGEVRVPGRRGIVAGGCLHDDIEQVFPELAHLIQWHLCDTSGPMHYLANATYFAGDADCNGKRAGEPDAWGYGYRFDTSPVVTEVPKSFFDFIESRRGTGEFYVSAVAHGPYDGTYKFKPKFTITGFTEKWHECPFDSESAAVDFAQALNKHHVTPVKFATSYSEGKARELDKARSVAVWPDASDAELSVPKEELTEALKARLPALLARMRSDVEAAGFLWECEA
jgi:hypothetical protein